MYLRLLLSYKLNCSSMKDRPSFTTKRRKILGAIEFLVNLKNILTNSLIIFPIIL